MKTKVIYSLRLMNYLIECGCELLEIRQHPFKVGLKAWVFVDNDLLQKSMGKFMEQRAKETKKS